MLDNTRVKLSADTPSLGVTSSSVPEVVGQDGSPAANFTDLLQAIVSGLDKGLGNLQDRTTAGADGKTVSSDNFVELMQKLSNIKGIGSDKKSASGNSMPDVLQQMMTQLQASFAQPVTLIAPYQPDNTSSSGTSPIAATGVDSGNGAGALIAAFESAIKKGDITKQSVIDTPGLPAAGQAAGKQLDVYPVPITQDTAVTDQSDLVTAQDNAQTSGANFELGAFSAEAQKILMNNTDRPAQNIANASAKNAPNAAILTITSDTRLNTANASAQNVPNAATLNIANDTGLNIANASAKNVPNAATLNTVDAAAQNTANTSMTSSERGALNSLIKSATGDLGIKEMSLTLNNQNKSVSGGSDNNAAFSPVILQQTTVANDSQPSQETLPVNKLNELSEPIMKTLGSGEKSLLIKLSPPDMGTIEIRLKMENGVLTADFKVDSNAVKDLFSIAMTQIKNSIENSCIKTGNFFADLKDDRSSDGGRQQDTNQQQQRQQKEQKPNFFDFFA